MVTQTKVHENFFKILEFYILYFYSWEKQITKYCNLKKKKLKAANCKYLYLIIIKYLG